MDQKIKSVTEQYFNRWKDDENVVEIVNKISVEQFLEYLNTKEWGIIPMQIRNDLSVCEEDGDVDIYKISDEIIVEVYNKIKILEQIEK